MMTVTGSLLRTHVVRLRASTRKKRMMTTELSRVQLTERLETAATGLRQDCIREGDLAYRDGQYKLMVRLKIVDLDFVEVTRATIE